MAAGGLGGASELDAHTTKNGDGRVFPITVDIEKILTEQAHDRQVVILR